MDLCYYGIPINYILYRPIEEEKKKKSNRQAVRKCKIVISFSVVVVVNVLKCLTNWILTNSDMCKSEIVLTSFGKCSFIMEYLLISVFMCAMPVVWNVCYFCVLF